MGNNRRYLAPGCGIDQIQFTPTSINLQFNLIPNLFMDFNYGWQYRPIHN